jgi:hypothetical protein
VQNQIEQLMFVVNEVYISLFTASHSLDNPMTKGNNLGKLYASKKNTTIKAFVSLPSISQLLIQIDA